MMYINHHNRDAEQLALLAEYESQRRRMETVREVHVLTDEEIEAEYQDQHEWQLDLEFIRMGGN